MKHIELFKDGFDSTVQEKIQPENWPYVGRDMVTSEIVYTKVPELFVTFTAQQDNSSVGLVQLSKYQTLEYSTDTISWNTFDTAINISLNNGDNVYVRGILSADNTNYYYTQFKMTGKIAASGNCNAIWNYQDLNAPLKKLCGFSMFNSCTSLTTAPELPSTSLASSCYEAMFRNCTALTTTPELPATTLASYCYGSMFWGCSSLIITPELPATELAYSCYVNMFYNCSSLITAPELPATMLNYFCYDSMFSGCTSLTIAPELPATELFNYCYQSMFSGCTSLTTTPELPATTLAEYCYRYMFNRCTNLNHITCLATDISASSCTNNWLKNISSTGIFYKHPDMSNWSIGISGIPEGWEVVDAIL